MARAAWNSLTPSGGDLQARLDDALSRPAAQQPDWPDAAQVAHVFARLGDVIEVEPAEPGLRRAAAALVPGLHQL